MKKTGFADTPLHPGRCPKWLFDRMKKLAGAITEAIVIEYGQKEFLERMSNPYFFQSLGCTLGFDWHSSGLTTTTCGALKEGLPDVGLAVCGGKGATSLKTPSEIVSAGDKLSISTRETEEMVYSSRMAAKVDNSAVQDGYQLYHHVFILSEKAEWAVVQQGLNYENKYARRYHWFSNEVESFVEEPQSAVCGKKQDNVLNMVASDSKEAQKVSVDVVNSFEMPRHHHIVEMGKRNMETLRKAYEIQPKNYEELLGIRGVGPKTIRSLALVSEIIYGTKPSWRDPAEFSFAHGGKDGIPYPVDRKLYDDNVNLLERAIGEAKVGKDEKLEALKRLKWWQG